MSNLRATFAFFGDDIMNRMRVRIGAILLVWSLSASCSFAQDVNSLLVRIKAVGKEGAGNADASKALKELIAKGPAVMPDVLAGMNDASPVAINWLRGAVEAIHDKAAAKGEAIPQARIAAFLQDTKHNDKARRLAYECLVKLDPKTPERLLPKMLDDPGSELRRDAVAMKLDFVKSPEFAKVASPKLFYQDLLTHARDRDQVDRISDELKNLGVEIDRTAHYGFVTRWLIAGPFDNGKGVGFNNVYPPEKGVDLKAVYQGKANQEVRWKECSAKSIKKDIGIVDFNESIGALHGVVGYGYAAVTSEAERAVELRAGSNNAVRIWLNGTEIYFREEYHHGMAMDQHVGQGILKAGRNEILIKVCQNEQKDSWAQLWSFQLRVCDTLGAAVPVSNVTEKVK
jgi:hypothetical protein